ncbi:MAG TPA: hypothetical protein VF556_17565 [Pyrinomonadaceae bacterium]
MKVAVVAYALAWNTKHNTGDIKLRLQNNQNIKLDVNSPDEFTAIATALNESPAFFETTTAVIWTGWE